MAYPPAPVAQPVRQGNGFGVTALVLGIVGAVFAIIPIINVFTAIPLGILAIIFGCVALGVSGKRGGKGKGTGGSGLVLGIIAVAGTFLINALVFNAVGNAIDQYYEEYKDECASYGFTDEECDRFIEDAEDL